MHNCCFILNFSARYYKTILVSEVLDWLKSHAAPLMLQVWRVWLLVVGAWHMACDYWWYRFVACDV
jgi:hypothetical protein